LPETHNAHTPAFSLSFTTKVFYHNASWYASEYTSEYIGYRIEGLDFWGHGIFLTIDPPPTARGLDDDDDDDDVSIGRL